MTEVRIATRRYCDFKNSTRNTQIQRIVGCVYLVLLLARRLVVALLACRDHRVVLLCLASQCFRLVEELGRLVFEFADTLVLRVDVRLHSAQLAGNAALSLWRRALPGLCSTRVGLAAQATQMRVVGRMDGLRSPSRSLADDDEGLSHGHSFVDQFPA